MKYLSGCWLLLLWVFRPAGVAAQAFAADSLVLTAPDFYHQISHYHPLIRRADLLVAEARQQIREARGAFDPKLFSYYDQKQFGNSLYYEKWQTGLALPLLPAGLDLKIAYDRAAGRYLNPENTLPPTGLGMLGVSVPLGRGLFTDARRNALQQARLAPSLAAAEQLKLVNKTLLDAAKAYWDWYLAYAQFRLLQEGRQLALTRFEAVRRRALLGDAAAIDTTEALITVQERSQQMQAAALAMQNARLAVTAFLWQPAGTDLQPAELPPLAIPQPFRWQTTDPALLATLLERATNRHPELLALDLKRGQLQIEERFRRAALQPQVVLDANLLSRTRPLGEWGNTYGFGLENRKIGLDMTFPLFLRKERGKLQQVQIKIEQLDLDRQQTRRQVENRLLQAWNDISLLGQQNQTYEVMVGNQTRLVQAERAKFDLGESSLFLVNSRESKLIDMQLKQQELLAKQQKAYAELWFAAGTSLLTP